MDDPEDLTWNARVNSTDPGKATVFVRRHQFDVGAPLQFDEEYDQVTALEYTLGAIASDIVVGLRRVAKRRRVEIDRVEALVKGRVDNPLTYLQVVGEAGTPALEAVTLKAFVSSVEPPERVQLVWDETLAASPLVHTLSRTVKLDLSHEVVI
jgi:hypothetical protein